MPVFEYACLECGRQFEQLQRAADPPAPCPSCGGENLRRLISLSAVSSDTRRAVSLSAAHQRAAARRSDKQRSEHAEHHGHFGDTARPKE